MPEEKLHLFLFSGNYEDDEEKVSELDEDKITEEKDDEEEEEDDDDEADEKIE